MVNTVVQLFEAENGSNGLKKLGKSNIALPSQTWEWSSVVEIDNGNLNSYPGQIIGVSLTISIFFITENTTEYYFNITSYNGKHGNTLQYGMLRCVTKHT